MVPSEQIEQLKQQVVPRMQEMGLSAFVIVGYLETQDGLQRICIANTARNPAFEDGLRPLINYAHIWGAPPAAFAPPKGEDVE